MEGLGAVLANPLLQGLEPFPLVPCYQLGHLRKSMDKQRVMVLPTFYWHGCLTQYHLYFYTLGILLILQPGEFPPSHRTCWWVAPPGHTSFPSFCPVLLPWLIKAFSEPVLRMTREIVIFIIEIASSLKVFACSLEIITSRSSLTLPLFFMRTIL